MKSHLLEKIFENLRAVFLSVLNHRSTQFFQGTFLIQIRFFAVHLLECVRHVFGADDTTDN